jgi:hypothetical protein
MGTKLHDLLERFGMNVSEEREFMDLDSDEQHSAVEKIAAYIEPFESGALKIYRELQVDLRGWNIPDCEFGTVDLAIDSGKGVFDMMDYKFGRIEVDDPETNIQMWAYALGIFAKFPKCKIIRIHILQPLRDEVGTATFSRTDIEKMHIRAQTIALRVRERAGKDFNPVLHNCRWCSNKANCTPLHEIALHIKKGASITIPNESVPLTKEAFNSNAVIIQYGSQVYDIADLMEQWGGSMRRKITSLVAEGHEVIGKRIIHKGGKTVVANAKVAAVELASQFNTTPIQIFEELAQFSMGSIDTMSANSAPKGAKDATKQEVRNRLRKAGVLTVGAPSCYLIDVK